MTILFQIKILYNLQHQKILYVYKFIIKKFPYVIKIRW